MVCYGEEHTVTNLILIEEFITILIKKSPKKKKYGIISEFFPNVQIRCASAKPRGNK